MTSVLEGGIMAHDPYRNFVNPVRSRYEFDFFDPRTWTRSVLGAGHRSIGVSDREEDEAYIDEVRRKHFRGRGPKNFRRSDDRIYEDVCDSLMHSRDVDASEMTVTVKDGIVELTGKACERIQKYIAEDIAIETAGVVDVRNLLTVAEHNRWGVKRNGLPS